MKTIGIVVVTYNRLQLLQECISAIRNQTYKDFDIIVVNNSSTDGTGEWLAAQNDLIVITQENCGGAGGFATGIKYSVEHKYKYTWVMDDDTIPSETALEELVKATITNPDFGFICSKVVDVQNNPCNYPSICYDKADNGEYIWLERSDERLLRVRCSTFVSVLINNSLCYEYGLPYREFFIWGDDIEFTMRFSDTHKCYLAMDSIVLHKRKSSQILSIFTEKDARRAKNYYYSYRNQIYSSAKRSKIKAVGWYVFGIGDMFKLLFKGQFSKANTILKALTNVLFFSPKIVFPNK